MSLITRAGSGWLCWCTHPHSLQFSGQGCSSCAHCRSSTRPFQGYLTPATPESIFPKSRQHSHFRDSYFLIWLNATLSVLLFMTTSFRLHSPASHPDRVSPCPQILHSITCVNLLFLKQTAGGWGAEVARSCRTILQNLVTVFPAWGVGRGSQCLCRKRHGHTCTENQQKCFCGYGWISCEVLWENRSKNKTQQFTGSGFVVGIEGRIKPDSVFLEECLSEHLLESPYIPDEMLI